MRWVLDSSDARAAAQAQHGEDGEIDLCIAVGIGVMLFDLELALVVKQTVQHKGGITFSALLARKAKSLRCIPVRKIGRSRIEAFGTSDRPFHP